MTLPCIFIFLNFRRTCAPLSVYLIDTLFGLSYISCFNLDDFCLPSTCWKLDGYDDSQQKCTNYLVIIHLMLDNYNLLLFEYFDFCELCIPVGALQNCCNHLYNTLFNGDIKYIHHICIKYGVEPWLHLSCARINNYANTL